MFIYKLISTILFIIILPFYSIIRFAKGKMYGWKEKLGVLPPFENRLPNDKVIMFHSVSVGETIAIENLVKKVHQTLPQHKIVITTGTKTGQEIAQKKYGEIASYITYFPFDIDFCVNRFLDTVNPTVVLMAETEIWPTFAHNCKKRNILLYTINGRISDSTYNAYKWLTPFFKTVFKNYTEILTQSEDDNRKFISIGSNPEKTRVMKNLKFDVKKSDDVVQIDKGENSRIIIAGSTHHEENEIVLNTFNELKQEFSDIKLLIAPRHSQRVPQIKGILENLKLNYGLRSQNDGFSQKDVIILDTMGELSKMYSICDIAFIGGSFNKTGGHNPLEATVYSKPAISGPDIHNFKDIYAILGKSKAGKVVKTPQEFKNYLKLLLSDKEFYQQACQDCEQIFNSQQGALDIVVDTLKGVF